MSRKFVSDFYGLGDVYLGSGRKTKQTLEIIFLG